MPGPVDLPAWQPLQEHQREMVQVHMRDLFVRDPQRFENFSLRLLGGTMGNPTTCRANPITCRATSYSTIPRIG